MRIHLGEDAKTFAIHTPRLITLAFRGSVKQELNSIVTKDIITFAREMTHPRCHLFIAVPKPHGGVRITTDLSKLNC